MRATLFEGEPVHSGEAGARVDTEGDATLSLARKCGALGAARGEHCAGVKSLFRYHWLAEQRRRAVIYAMLARAGAWDE